MRCRTTCGWSRRRRIRAASSHSLSLNDPLRLREISDRHFAVKGTPTDCVIMGVRHLMRETKPDLVLSGVNRGPERCGGRELFRHRRGRHRGHDPRRSVDRAVAGLWRRQPQATSSGNAPSITDRRSCARSSMPASTRASSSTSTFPIASRMRSIGAAVVNQGVRTQELLKLDERSDGRGNPYFWIGFERRPFTPGNGTDLWAIANRRIADHAVASRHDRRADADALRAGFRLRQYESP